MIRNEGTSVKTSIPIAPHEAMQLHELLTFKNVCATKTSAMVGLVKDEELKSLMEQDFRISAGHIRELQGLIQLPFGDEK